MLVSLRGGQLIRLPRPVSALTIVVSIVLAAHAAVTFGSQAGQERPPNLPPAFDEPLAFPRPPADAPTEKPRRVFLELRLAEVMPVRGLAFEAQLKNSQQKVYVHYTAVATHTDVLNARVLDSTGRYEIALTLTPEAGAALTSATTRHTGRPLAIILDGEVVSVLMVRNPLGAEVVFSGGFSREEAGRIAAGLRRW
jgi:SecDF, P1 head subdomain